MSDVWSVPPIADVLRRVAADLQEAELERALVGEARCELPHRRGTVAGEVTCSGAAMAVLVRRCDPAAPLCCEAAASIVARFLRESPFTRCHSCKDRCRDCWGIRSV